VAALPPGATFGAADKYAEKPSIWPKALAIAFVFWFVWSFLNDSQGRLWRWTDGSDSLAPIHKLATVPAAVQKALDEAATKTKPAAPAAAPAASAAIIAATNAVPAK